MLTIHQRPILTCLDFFRYFDLEEILRQPSEFVQFARGHLHFDFFCEKCIEMFELAASGKKLKCFDERWFWQNERVPGTEGQNTLIAESYVFEKRNHGTETGWENRFIMKTAAMLLGRVKFQVEDAENMDRKMKQHEVGRQPVLPLLELKEKEMILRPGTYRVPSDFSDIPREKWKKKLDRNLSTVKLGAENDYTSDVRLLVADDRMLELPSGHFVYCTVSDGKVVRILPDEVATEWGTLKRSFQAGCITMDGRPTMIPLDASSFTCVGRGKYMYLQDGRLKLIGLNNAEVPDYQQRNTYVELRAVGKRYYLLNPEGVAATQENLPDAMKRHFLSLEEALKGMGEG